MNPFRWRARADVDAPDPVLTAWFTQHGRLPGGDEDALDRGRRLVAARLEAPRPATGGASLWRRLTWAGAGGGGLWASALGAAAAHPLVGAATALALVAGGTTAVEVSGVGSVVREAVGIHAHSVDDTPSPATNAAATSTNQPNLDAGTPGPYEGALTEPAPDGLPGNLVTQLHNGRFLLRAQLVAADGESITVLGTEGTTTLPLADDAAIRIPGTPDLERSLATVLGQLVHVTGVCESDIEVVGAGCTVERVQVLGGTPPASAPADEDSDLGNPGKPEKPGKPEDGGDKPGNGSHASHDGASEHGSSGDKPSDADGSKLNEGQRGEKSGPSTKDD